MEGILSENNELDRLRSSENKKDKLKLLKYNTASALIEKNGVMNDYLKLRSSNNELNKEGINKMSYPTDNNWEGPTVELVKEYSKHCYKSITINKIC